MTPGPLVVRVGVVGSTNDEARRLAADGAPHGTAVLADAQTAGRGRLGRRWEAPPGACVLMSVVVRTPLPPERVALLSLGAAVATARACGEAYRIKWPNDVLAPDGRKVAGILAEAEWDAGRLRFAVVGIGVNVRAAPDLPGAGYLEALGPPRDRDTLALAIRDGVLAEAERAGRDPDGLLAGWRAASHTLGRHVRVGVVEGTAIDVDAAGALVVRTQAGVERVLAGDVC